MLIEKLILSAILALMACGLVNAAGLLPGFEKSPWFGEQERREKADNGVRWIINAPAELHPDRPTRLIVFATPNGNTVEQTLGSALSPEMDWHYDIQHIAAQTRRLREVDKRENIVLACMQTSILAWPAWGREHENSAVLIKGMIDQIAKEIPGKVTIDLTCHSGGGSLLSRFVDADKEIPEQVKRIAFLDANYSYSDDEGHGDKYLAWLRKSPENHLVVIAYDDREILYDGKRVVGPTGGTFRASQRMLNRFEKEVSFKQSHSGPIDRYEAMNGQIEIFLHRNPANKILHTVLVGEMNGYLEAMTLGTPEEHKWGEFGAPRAYTKWIQPAATTVDLIPPRPKNAEGGIAFMKRIAPMPAAEREAAILAELQRGNLPSFLRKLKSIRVKAKDAKGKEHTAVYQAMPDYLAVGSDRDFVRTPMTPMTAQAVADALGCALTTRKMANDIYQQAEVKLEPRPLTEAREAVETFVQHNAIIETQRAGKPLGALVAGIKKDVVITNLLQQKARRVAIYGWHKLDGSPIQPMTTVHVNTYVDYSHGIRLVKRTLLVDGNPRDLRDILADPNLNTLLSDEGPIEHPSY